MFKTSLCLISFTFLIEFIQLYLFLIKKVFVLGCIIYKQKQIYFLLILCIFKIEIDNLEHLQYFITWGPKIFPICLAYSTKIN